MQKDCNSIDDIFKELSRLTQQSGFFYVLLFMIEEDLFLPISQIKYVNYRSRISVKEASMLLGLIVKGNNSILAEPKDIQSFLAYRKEAYCLLEKLHRVMFKPLSVEIRKQANANLQGEKVEFSSHSETGKAQYYRESFFYTNEPAYDLEYLFFATVKYHYDKEWLQLHVEFDIDEVVPIVLYLKKQIDERLQRILYYPKEKIKEIFQHDSGNKIIELERYQDYCALYKYEALYETPTIVDETKGYIDSVNIHGLCKTLLRMHLINKEELAFDEAKVQSFFNVFSLEVKPDTNQNFIEPGGLNEVVGKPIIKVKDNCYILPMPYLLAQSVYETPYYWMNEDESYRKIAGSHIGTSGEDLVYFFLSSVFGTSHTFQNVTIKKGKQDQSEIDVLCLLGSKALCVQVKSKKLTQKAQTGDEESYNKDFKGAITDAYKQGLKCRKLLLSKACDLIKNDGGVLDVSHIDEVYLLCVTTGFYPALPQQVRMLLNIEEHDATPVVFNLFDLHIIAYYLRDPYEFLYYIRQRAATNDYFYAENESVLLVYHLRNKLKKNPKYKTVVLDQSLADAIDKDYGNICHLLPNSAPSLHCEWISEPFSLFLSEIKRCNNPYITDVIFDLYDADNKVIDSFIGNISRVKQQSLQDKSLVSMYKVFDEKKVGISYIASKDVDTYSVCKQMEICSMVHKYKSKADKWIAVACSSSHLDNVEYIMFDMNPWKRDEKIEIEIKEFDAINRSSLLKSLDKIGRNDPCPCGSGKKYKKCHGRN